MFEYYHNQLCVQANWLEEIGVITVNNLKVLCHRGKVRKARAARGFQNYALYFYESLPQRFRNIIEHDMGIDPYENVRTIKFSKYLKWDEEAAQYFADYELENGTLLADKNYDKVEEYTANICIFKAITSVSKEVMQANPKTKKTELWKKLATAVHNLSDDLKKRYPFDLPKNPRALRAKYEACLFNKASKRYPRTGLEGIIHDNYCNSHSLRISEEVGQWILAKYGHKISYSIYELMQHYKHIKENYGWPTLSESAVQNFLDKPENKRVWMANRDTEKYEKLYGHTLTRDRRRMFSNAHWAIDGTKFDAVHYWDNTRKMAALCKIDVCFDVYSEKIIGSSFSFTENHVDHFIALKQAVNTTNSQPLLFTYDHQSGHKTKKMQDLYDRIVAKGGTHYPHQVGRKSNPAEGMFNRLQQQVIGKYWFFDGQGIKTRQSRSTRDLKAIQKNKESLPSFEELVKYWELMVEQWNAMPRTKKETQSRTQVYEAGIQKAHLDPLDQISMFWIEETRPKKYYGHGMPLTVAGEDYLFEVYDENGAVDLEFRQKYVQEQLIVSYDPEFLDQFVKLYRTNELGQKVFVAYAEKKREHQIIPTLSKKGEKSKWLEDFKVRDLEKNRDQGNYNRYAEKFGLNIEKTIEEQALNNLELNSKLIGVAATKEEQHQTENHLLDKFLNN